MRCWQHFWCVHVILAVCASDSGCRRDVAMLAKFAFASWLFVPSVLCHCLFIFTIFRLLKQLTIKQHFSNWMKRFASSASDMLRWKCAPSELKPVLNGLLHSLSPIFFLAPVSGPASYEPRQLVSLETAKN